MFEKNNKRAIRRQHKRRMKEKAKKVYYFNSPEVAIKLADNLQFCSKQCCGNPRNHGYDTPRTRDLKRMYDVSDYF